MKKINMKKIKAMIESAPTRMDAINILNTWRTFYSLSEENYEQGRELIRQEFAK